MNEISAKSRPEKVQEPEWTWGETPGGQPEVVWEHSARPLWAQALAGRGRVLLIEMGRLACREIASGAVLWEQPSRELPDELAFDAGGFVLAAGREIRELDGRTGAARWRQQMGGVVNALALDESTVYVATRGPLCAVRRSDGKLRWKVPASWEPELHVHPAHGLLVLDAPETETIQAYDTVSGEARWEFSGEGQPLVAGPLVGDVLAVSNYEAGAVGLDARTGEERWRLQTESTFEAAGVAADGRLFVTDGSVCCVDPSNGALLWRRDPADEAERFFSLRPLGDTLYAETWRGRLLALDPADGAIRWETQPGQVHGLTADAPRLFARLGPPGDDRHWTLAALDRSTGALLWELRARRMIPDATVVGDVLLVELKTQVLALRLG